MTIRWSAPKTSASPSRRSAALPSPPARLVTVTPAAPPASLDAVRAKIQGRTLSAPEISAIVNDIAHYRYSDMEIAAFLIGAAQLHDLGRIAGAGRRRWPRPARN